VTTEQLAAFIEVAARRKLTEAAKRLGQSQPAVSRQIQSLETELGLRLLVRTPQGVVLTEAGERFLAHAREALATLREGASELHEIARSPRGPVSLGALPTVGAYLLPDIVPVFLKQFPDVQLRLTEALPEPLKESVADGKLDLALVELPLRRQDLVAQKLWVESYSLIVPREHPLASSRAPVPFSAVVGQPVIVVAGGRIASLLREVCASRGEELRVALEVNHPSSQIRMVERGVGIAVLPELLAREHRGGRFVPVPIEGGPQRTVALVHRGERSLNYGARALKNFLAERLIRGRAPTGRARPGP
jgi:DNA-binding transcriptional LysR family regulator